MGYNASVKIWISIRKLKIYDRKRKMFVEFHNKSMSCCIQLIFCRVAIQQGSNKNNVKVMQ